jgi:acyl dehydratase
MAFDFAAAMAAAERDLPYAYDDARTRLYALAIGMGRDPLDRAELAFLDETRLAAVPSFATMIAWMARDVRRLGVDYDGILHGEQRLVLHRPLPVAARLLADTSTLGVHDKGADKGALVRSEVAIRLADDGAPLATLEIGHFARYDGGFAKSQGDSGPAPRPAPVPSRPPDLTIAMPTRPEQALAFRLLGDDNRLHIDPAAAARAGFPRPILQGVCTYGICCHAVLRHCIGYDAAAIRRFDVRFTGVLFPGETLAVELWRDGTEIRFRAACRERGTPVIDNGYCLLGEAA